MGRVDEPPPLLDSESEIASDLRLGLEGLRSRVPDADRLAALAAKLGIPGGPMGPATPAGDAPPDAQAMGSNAASTAPAVPGTATGAKLLLGVVLALGGAAALAYLWPDSRLASHPAQPAATARAIGAIGAPHTADSVAKRALPAAQAFPPGASAAPPSAPTEARQADFEPLVRRAAPQLGSEPDGSRVRAPSAGAVPPELSPAARAPAAPAPGQKTSGAQRSRTAASTRTSEPVASPGTPSEAGSVADRPRSEAELLLQARAALPSNPADAFRLTEQHRSLYPRGTMMQEREMIAITALVRLGRTEEARARAERFRRAYPSSAYVRQLEGLLGH